jgi:hypothetical protein
MTSNVDLKPCPCCGGSEVCVTWCGGLWNVECSSCLLMMANRLTECEAIEYWNRRTK